MIRPSPHQWSRRELLTFTTKLAAVGITTSLTPELIFGQTGRDLKGVTIDYWNAVGTQNPAARRVSEAVIAAFEQRTGAKVNVAWDSYDSLSSGNTLLRFESGSRPAVMDAMSRWTGALRPWLRPINDLMEGAWDPEVVKGFRWTLPLIESQNAGFSDAKSIYDLPFGLIPQAGVLTRRDHWHKGNLILAENWPIKDSIHLLSVLIGLRDSSRIRYPMEAYGNVPAALAKQIGGWVRSLNPAPSTLLNADWTASTADDPAWQTAVQFYIDLGRKFKLTTPGWQDTADVEAVDRLIKGEQTIVYASPILQHTLLARASRYVQDQTFIWGLPIPLKGGKAESQGYIDFMTLSIVKQEGPDAELKELAAWEFIKEWFTKANQVAYTNAAVLGSRADLWPVAFDPRDRWMRIVTQLIVNGGLWPNHPRAAEIFGTLFTKHVKRAQQGEAVATVLGDYARDVNTLLQA